MGREERSSCGGVRTRQILNSTNQCRCATNALQKHPVELMVKFITYVSSLSVIDRNDHQDSIETAVQLRENVEHTRNHLDFMAITCQNTCMNQGA